MPKIKTQKSTSVVQTLKKLIGGSAGVIDKIIDSFGATDDLRVLFYIEFLKQRKTPYGVKDIPNGKQKFAKFAAQFFEPVLNGDLNTTNYNYISALKKFLKTGKFVFNKGVVLHLEDYFKSPVTGYYGFRGIDYKERERGGKSSLAARFSSNIMMELTNSLGRYALIYNNGVATINDDYDFDDVNDFYNRFKRKGNKEYSFKTFKKNIIRTIKDKFGDIEKTSKDQFDKKISLKSIKKASLNRFLYNLMFDANEMIHTDGYQGYKISLKFPMTVDKSRLIANIKRLEDALNKKNAAIKAAAMVGGRSTTSELPFGDKESQRQQAFLDKSPARRKPYKPTKCINSKTCFEYGAKCIDLTELEIAYYDKLPQDFKDSPEAESVVHEFGKIDYFGAFIALGLMKPKEALEAQKFVPRICLPMEMLDAYGNELKDDLFRTEKSVRQIFALYKQTIKGVLEEAQYKEIKEIFKRYL